QALLDALERVNLAGLPDMVGGLDAVLPWSEYLSPGQQQLIQFARVILAGPKFVVMDESTSALDLENEELVYKLIGELHVTFISISHRKSLLRFHRRVLKLHGDTKWSLIDAEEFREASNKDVVVTAP